AMWAPSFSGGKARISSSGRSAASLVRASGKASAQNRIFMDIFLWLSRVIRPSVRPDTDGYLRHPGRAYGAGGGGLNGPLCRRPKRSNEALLITARLVLVSRQRPGRDHR